MDGFRYDQVSVIDHDGAPHGWSFCQDLTSTLRQHRPGALDKAEYWDVNPYIVKAPPEGAGFDTTLSDGLRIAIRDVIGNASQPDERPLNLTGLARSLWPEGFSEHWRFVQGPENHDIVYQAAILILAERGCVEDQPQRVDSRNSLVLCGDAAAGRDDTAALRAKMRIAGQGQCERVWLGGVAAE